ncbi:MAG: LptF/LptG family permease [Gammaproteobacteria bacterium]
MHFDEYEIVINAPEQQGSRVSLSSMPTLDLLGENSLKASIELQSRLLLPLSVIAFGLLAIPLSRSSPRKSSYLNLVLAVVFYMTFMALLKSADQWMLLGLTPAWMGLWWILVVMFLIAPVIEGYDQMRFRLARRRRAAA